MNSKPESWGVVQSPTAECVCFPKPEPVSIMMMSARLYKGLPCSSSHSSFGGKGIVFWKVCHRASNSSAHIGESQKGIKGMQHSNMFWHCFIDSSPRIHWSFTLAEPCFFTQTPICVTLVLRGVAWYWYCMILHDIAWFYTHRPPSVSLLSWNQHFTRLPWPRSPSHYIALHVITSDLRSHFIIFSAFQIICSQQSFSLLPTQSTFCWFHPLLQEFLFDPIIPPSTVDNDNDADDDIDQPPC